MIDWDGVLARARGTARMIHPTNRGGLQDALAQTLGSLCDIARDVGRREAIAEVKAEAIRLAWLNSQTTRQ